MRKPLQYFQCILTVLLLLALATHAIAQQAPTLITSPGDLTKIFDDATMHWLTVTDSYATELFWALATLDIIIFGLKLWWDTKGDLSLAMMAIVNKLLVVGFFVALLANGSQWIPWIINDFTKVGKEASGVPQLTPSLILKTGFDIVNALVGNAVMSGFFLDFPTALGMLIAGAAIAFAFFTLTKDFIVTKISTFVSIGLGHFMLAFGGSRWTATYAERYIALAFSCGVQMFVLYALIGGGWQLTNTWVEASATAALEPAGVLVAWKIAIYALLYAFVCHYVVRWVNSIMTGAPALAGSDAMAMLAPVIAAGVSSALIASGLASGAGAAGAAGAAGGATGPRPTPGPMNIPPTGGMPGGRPHTSPGPTGMAARAAAQAAAGAGRAIQSIPHAGHHAPPPRFSGFDH
jgi:type IV secretion system protein TrbL